MGYDALHANRMTKITNFAPSGPIGLKIGQRCGFLPEITYTKFQLSDNLINKGPWTIIGMVETIVVVLMVHRLVVLLFVVSVGLLALVVEFSEVMLTSPP